MKLTKEQKKKIAKAKAMEQKIRLIALEKGINLDDNEAISTKKDKPVGKKRDWLFVGQFPTGVSYADKRIVDKDTKDYAKIAFVYTDAEKDIIEKTSWHINIYNDSKEEYRELIEELIEEYGTSYEKKIPTITESDFKVGDLVVQSYGDYKKGKIAHKSYFINSTSGKYKWHYYIPSFGFNMITGVYIDKIQPKVEEEKPIKIEKNDTALYDRLTKKIRKRFKDNGFENVLLKVKKGYINIYTTLPSILADVVTNFRLLKNVTNELRGLYYGIDIELELSKYKKSGGIQFKCTIEDINKYLKTPFKDKNKYIDFRNNYFNDLKYIAADLFVYAKYSNFGINRKMNNYRSEERLDMFGTYRDIINNPHKVGLQYSESCLEKTGYSLGSYVMTNTFEIGVIVGCIESQIQVLKNNGKIDYYNRFDLTKLDSIYAKNLLVITSLFNPLIDNVTFGDIFSPTIDVFKYRYHNKELLSVLKELYTITGKHYQLVNSNWHGKTATSDIDQLIKWQIDDLEDVSLKAVFYPKKFFAFPFFYLINQYSTNYSEETHNRDLKDSYEISMHFSNIHSSFVDWVKVNDSETFSDIYDNMNHVVDEIKFFFGEWIRSNDIYKFILYYLKNGIFGFYETDETINVAKEFFDVSVYTDLSEERKVVKSDYNGFIELLDNNADVVKNNELKKLYKGYNYSCFGSYKIREEVDNWRTIMCMFENFEHDKFSDLDIAKEEFCYYTKYMFSVQKEIQINDWVLFYKVNFADEKIEDLQKNNCETLLDDFYVGKVLGFTDNTILIYTIQNGYMAVDMGKNDINRLSRIRNADVELAMIYNILNSCRMKKGGWNRLHKGLKVLQENKTFKRILKIINWDGYKENEKEPVFSYDYELNSIKKTEIFSIFNKFSKLKLNIIFRDKYNFVNSRKSISYKSAYLHLDSEHYDIQLVATIDKDVFNAELPKYHPVDKDYRLKTGLESPYSNLKYKYLTFQNQQYTYTKNK